MSKAADVVLGVIQAIEERRGEDLFAYYHEDLEIHDAPSLPYGGVAEGKASLAEQLAETPEETWLGTWGPLQPTDAERKMDPRILAEPEGDDDGEVVVLYRQRAVSAEGERFDSPVIAIYEVRDGKFARAQMFHWDTDSMNRFLERARESDASLAA